uniref:Wolfram syndrome 1a (wolframin) n=1 Tax=Labrus bergylta TaxID=56723 RepID=A0A3Q3E8J4_9LABR
MESPPVESKPPAPLKSAPPAKSKTPLVTSSALPPQIPKVSSFSKLTSASYTQTSFDNTTADAPPTPPIWLPQSLPPPWPRTLYCSPLFYISCVFQLGQHYLLLAEEKDTEQNNQLAVDWLLKAAKQGRKAAARALQRCWIQRKGMTPENEEDVRKLATESKFELAVRKAAMMMYWKLNPDRKKKVAVAEMLENVSQVNAEKQTNGKKRKNMLSFLLYSLLATQLVDLDDFVEITKKYAQGIVPSAPQKVTTKTKILKPQDSTEEMLQYPLHSIVEMKEHLVDWASRAGVQWLSTAIPTQHVNALIFFFIISNLTVDLFAFVIPLLVFYLSFISMIICTLRVFQSSKTWENFSALTSLLTQTEFGWNNLEPYLYFILSVFFIIFSFPVADKGWIPCSELSTVAIFFTAVSYNSLSPTAAMYARRAMVIEVASSLCCLTQFLPEKMAIRLLGHTFATLPLGESVVLKISLPCLLYVYLFYLFFSMARMRGFRGTYCFLVPYLVCFMWCEFSVVLLQNSSAVGLIRTCVAYFLFLFALPVLAFGLAAMLFIQICKWFLELELTKVIVTLVVCAIPVTLRLWTRFSMSILDVFRSLTHRGPVKLILLGISMVILLFAIYVYHAEGQKVYNSTMTWSQYSQVCGPPAWETKGMAQTQLFCSHLQGHRVTWTGRFRHVRVADTENGAQSVISMLPVFIGDWLRCLYGERYPKCEPKNATVANLTLCELKALAKHTCHIKRFDSHRFEVTVGMIRDGSMDDPARDINLMASHEFRQVLLNLSPGNMVEFSTKLDGRLGARAPAFELKAIHCMDCATSLLTGSRQVKIERDWRRTTMRALKFAFDFFFYPFLSAKISD